MNRKDYMKWLLAAFITGAGLSLFSCGSSGGGGSPAAVAASSSSGASGSLSCGSGYYNVNGFGCTYGSSFDNACYYAGGNPISLNGQDTCETQTYGNLKMTANDVPYLAPGFPSATYYTTSLQLYTGDKITFQTVQGGYGTLQQGQLLGGLFNWYSNNCNANSISSSSLYVSDGIGVYPVNSNTITIQSNGYLQFGLNNAAAQQGQYGCAWASTYLTVIRCMTSGGNVLVCP